MKYSDQSVWIKYSYAGKRSQAHEEQMQPSALDAHSVPQLQ